MALDARRKGFSLDLRERDQVGVWHAQEQRAAWECVKRRALPGSGQPRGMGGAPGGRRVERQSQSETGRQGTAEEETMGGLGGMKRTGCRDWGVTRVHPPSTIHPPRTGVCFYPGDRGPKPAFKESQRRASQPTTNASQPAKQGGRGSPTGQRP